MRILLLQLLFISAIGVKAQTDHICSKAKKASMASLAALQARAANTNSLISHEIKYDVKFVHLNLNLERTTKYMSGNAVTVARVVAPVLDTFMTLLHQNHTIDSIYFNGVSMPFTRADSAVKVVLPVPLTTNTSFTAIVYYEGMPPNGGAFFGSGMNNANASPWNTQVTWSISDCLVGFHWWPCKQALTDKIDSSWVFITTDSTNKAGSNGVLKNVVTVGSKKRYEWKSSSPIDYYLISVAVSRYTEYKLYAKPLYLVNDSILIQNYVYTNAFNNNTWINTQKPSLDQLPDVLELECMLYDMYPFKKEKYGHCMAPIGGGMEHQTMTTIGFFDYYLNAHELAHQWWGNSVTCKTWSDIWINEAFASYTEYLVANYLNPTTLGPNVLTDHNLVMTQPGGSVFFSGPDTLNMNVIFDSRLTYAKGGAIIRSLQFVTNNDSLWFNTLRGFLNLHKNGNASVVDFKNYYEAQTGINATSFFNQWYYGQGYPTFTIKYNTSGNTCVIKSVQSVSMPTVTPLFTTPVEYKIYRLGAADTVVRVMHTNPVEVYSFNLSGTVTAISCDPDNWLINKVVNEGLDTTLITDIARITNLPEVSVWPNPAKNSVSVRASGSKGLTLALFDTGGKLLFTKSFVSETNMDISNYANGMYILQVSDKNGDKKYTQKIIKE